MTGCAALGIAPPAGLVEPPPANWDASVGAAFDALVVPLLEPSSLLGMAAFGIGAAVAGMGPCEPSRRNGGLRVASSGRPG